MTNELDTNFIQSNRCCSVLICSFSSEYDAIVLAADVIMSTSGGLGFTQVNSALFLVNNPLTTPVGEWQSTSTTFIIPNTGGVGKLSFSNGLTLVEEEETSWLYVWGRKQVDHLYFTVLARVTVDDVVNGNLENRIQYLQNEQSGAVYWATVLEFDFDKLYTIPGLSGQPEMTVQYSEQLSLWYTFGLNFLSFDIQLYTASNITGPYTLYPEAVYNIPPPLSKISGGFCYAIKSHPELAGDNEFIITYNCNGGNWGKNVQDTYGFYIPQMVRITFSPNR
eukprot:TRINITY_DN1867_c0_g1_i2.p1 TRINITY_DN1867_c0_g1~~TRINITY_DN1867_c0_g1_i2.p1  ORF type:complete len:279 (+),score=47.50 TRINITY_DN1867_c0_g1_i2:602-1438(+)